MKIWLSVVILKSFLSCMCDFCVNKCIISHCLVLCHYLGVCKALQSAWECRGPRTNRRYFITSYQFGMNFCFKETICISEREGWIYSITYFEWWDLWDGNEIIQSCPTLCDPMDCSLSGSSVHGIFQARVLECIAISFSRGSSLPRNRTRASCITGRRFAVWATRKVVTSTIRWCLPDSWEGLHWVTQNFD